MNWRQSKPFAFLTCAACTGGICALLMFGWFHLSHGKTQDVELSVLKSKVTELETYRADYNTLLHKYNILMFQKISQHNTLKGKTTNTDPVVQDNHSLAGVDLIPHQEKDKNHSIVIDRLVYLP